MLRHSLFCAFIVFLFAITFAGVQFVHAQDCKTDTGFVPLECFNQSPKLDDVYNTTALGPFLQRIFVGAISLGAMLAVLRLAWAGFVYMSSDLWSAKEHSKEIIKDTLLGLFLLLAIYLILQQINPDILSLEVNPSRSPSAAETGTTEVPN